jgi:hypothetical protein
MEFPEDIAASYRESAAFARAAMEKASGQHIYVFRAGDHVKVGVAANPMKRWKAIASCNPLLEVDCFITAKKYPNAKWIEKWVHAELKEHHVKLEWFSCDLETAVAALMKVLSRGSSG